MRKANVSGVLEPFCVLKLNS